jgi:hypothetical protein
MEFNFYQKTTLYVSFTFQFAHINKRSEKRRDLSCLFDHVICNLPYDSNFLLENISEIFDILSLSFLSDI